MSDEPVVEPAPVTLPPAAGRPAPGRFAALVGRPVREVSPVPRDARPYQGHRAGLVSRFAADAIDFVVVLAILVLVYLAVQTLRFLGNPSGYSFRGVTFGEALLVGAVVLFGYLTLGWWLSGRTYGKHVMGLRVVNRRGGRMRLVACAARAAICLLVPITILWVAVSRQNRSVADIVLRSSVVYDWSVRREGSAVAAPASR